MSWSVSKTGKPNEIVEELERLSGVMGGQSKVEFDDAKPHLEALVRQNFDNFEGAKVPTLELSASGHGSARDGEQMDRTCQVSIRQIHTMM